MDIRKWLDETVQPEVTRESIKSSRKAEPARKKRFISDSSLLEAPSPRRQTPEDQPDVCSEDSQASNSSGAYERKPRRKTRPEHFELSSKVTVEERGGHAHNRKGESKKTRRKSKRKKSDKTGSGVMQNFHAQNVTGDRLTLKPQLGIFNKGRTSTAIKGRGSDLRAVPDLVFSEMKFLQKQPELNPQSVIPKKKRKKDHLQTKEGEISAFFTSVQPALSENNGNTLLKDDRPNHDNLLEVKGRGRERSSMVDAAMPTIEMDGKTSYLGFGSRGPRHESTSYMSWSESIRAPSTTLAHPRVEAVARADQLNPSIQDGQELEFDEKDTPFKRPAPRSVNRRRTDTSAECFGVSSMAPSHHRVSRSQSYPQHTSSPRRVNLVDRSAKFQSMDTVCPPSSMPPFLPGRASVDVHQAQPTSSTKHTRSRTIPFSDVNNLTEHQQQDPNGDYNGTDIEPQTSSDLGRVLQQCNDTYERRQAVTPRRRNTERIDQSYSTSRAARQAHMDMYPTTRPVHSVRFADTMYRAPVLPNFAGPSIYEQQAHRQQPPMQPFAAKGVDQGSYPIEREYFDENGEMLDDEQNWEGLPEPTSYGLEGEHGIYGVEETYVAEDVAQHLVSNGSVVAPGFWRPNRLY
ncbi:hypothetical protein EJ02DRAFT_341821 [Clathrospora elynae]|uniref:Uncharacterized protein n=1 Tax=Clathrospora elynae TaxID=706981 RepID=A0A6A5SWB2_9PLEO|nr:hypothetical protein EJ02DRAFT_341821 [Clathrospora elynae]